VHLAGIVARDMAGTAFNDFSTTTFENVHVIGAGMSGFRMENDSTLTGCVVQGASQAGYLFNGGDGTISKSLAVANRSSGVQVSNGTVTLDGMSLLANVFAGVIENGSDVTVTRSTIMGNARGADGCGASIGVGGSLVATNDFWGSSDGPDGAGADLACTNGPAVQFTPFKSTEIKVVPKAVR
jgi:parallel beta helix pectate lyase-like protein